MFGNYLKVAWRNLLKDKAHTFINMSGLSAGMAVAMIIGLWIWDEISYDTYFENSDWIVAVMQHQTLNDQIMTQKDIPIPLGVKLRDDYKSDFKYVVLSTPVQSHIISFKDKILSLEGSYMQPDAPDMLTLKMLKGTRSGLKDFSSILISAKFARSVFGDLDPMGSLITIDKKYAVKVAGVYEDLPRNTFLGDMAFVAPWDLYMTTQPNLKQAATDWRNNSWYIYAQLNLHADIDKVSAAISDLRMIALGLSGDKAGVSFKASIFLHPMRKWHLYSEFKNGVNTGGKIEFVWMFGVIAVFVLLLACINFMNLSTARSEKRAKEVGIRKTLGALRQQLIGQFFCESLLMSGFSFLASILIVLLILPWFNQVADKQLGVLWGNPLFWLGGVGFALMTGIIAGSYPAFYLSSFQPVKVLKGTFKAGALAALPRKALVVLQLTVSVTLIIGTLVVFRQVQYTKFRPVGYSRDRLIQAYFQTSDIFDHFAAVKYDLIHSGAISQVAESGSPITAIWNDVSGITWRGKSSKLQDDFGTVAVDEDFGKTVAWKITDGRDFSKEYISDSSAVVINESAAKFMNLKNPVGETIRWFKDFKIIGVIKDMVMTSPYEPVPPTLFYLLNEPGQVINIKISPKAGTREALDRIEAVFKQYDPGSPFNYRFTDEVYARKFQDEERIGKLAGFFTILAIFISCMGLYGMASFMAEQRVKEIGVRKMLGASVFSLWRLMSKESVILVIISLAIAIPIALYFMEGWLRHYQYRAGISWWIFFATALGAVLLALLTVSYQSVKAALANPLKSLKNQ